MTGPVTDLPDPEPPRLPDAWPFPERYTRAGRPVYPAPDPSEWPEALL